MKNILTILYCLFICTSNIFAYTLPLLPKTHGADDLFQIALDNYPSHPDTTISYLEFNIEDYKKQHDTLNAVTGLLQLSMLYAKELEYTLAYQAAWDALQLSETSNDSTNISQSYEILSFLYSLYGQSKNANTYINKAISIEKQLLKRNWADTNYLVNAYYKAAINCRFFEEYDKALTYIDSTIELSQKIGQDSIHQSYIYTEQAYLYIMKRKYDQAEDILHKVKLLFESLPDDNDYYHDHIEYLTIIYIYLGDLYAARNQADMGIHYYMKALVHLKEYKLHLGMQHYITYNLALLLEKKGNLSKAFEAMHASKYLYDSIYGIRSQQNIQLIEIKNTYEEEIEQKNQELYEHTLLIAKKERTLFKVRIVVFSLLFIIIIGMLVVRNRNQRVRFALEKKNTARENELKEEAARNLIEVKNKELTTYTLQFIEKDKTIKSLIEKLKSANNHKDIEAYLQSLKVDHNLWEEFNHRFNSVNGGFYERLGTQFPNLSSTEMKHCALIKLNFTGKEMAHLLGITLSSVHISRHRIRKKMGLDRDTSLSAYISSL